MKHTPLPGSPRGHAILAELNRPAKPLVRIPYMLVSPTIWLAAWTVATLAALAVLA